MQNFTLGKKGITMLLFGLVLLIGSVPSYGQTCPTTIGTPPNQSFCYLQTVGEIDTDGDAVFQTANTTSDSQPIPASEILESGIYYAGSSTGSCARIPVNVTVNTTPHPDNTLYPGSTSFSISPCLNTDFSAEDLAGFFTPLNTDYDIIVYEDEFGTGPASGQLTPNESYFVGQVYTGGGLASDNCPSLRVAVGYNPANAPVPTATSPQVFCEGATVADLVAQGTSPFTQAIRWYRTVDSFQPLAASTILIHGQTYYASQIINDRNDPFPPCESIDRAAVTVTVQQPVDLGTPEPGVVCESDVSATFPSIDEIRKFYLALLPEGTPTNGTFSRTPAQLAQDYQNDEDGLGSFTTVYTVGVDGCESSVELTVTIVAEEEAEAGTIDNIEVPCGRTDIVVLDDTLLSEDATTGGSFSGEDLNEDGNFDPAIGPGTYTITYSVDDTADCVIEGTSDFTTFTITVQGSLLGEPIVLDRCIIEVQELATEDAIAIFTAALAERGVTNSENGDFSPSLEDVADEIAAYVSDPTPSQTFETTYSVLTDCGEDIVSISLTINDTTAPEAGDITPAPVCASATPFNLNSLLGDNNNPGGTFSNENGQIEDGLFDVSQTGPYNITYSVTASDENCTAGEPDATDFTLTVNEGIVAESPENAIVCESDVQALFPSNDEVRKFYVAIAQQAGFPTNGTFDPNVAAIVQAYQDDEDGLGEFTTTYTFGGGDCQTSVDLTVEIVPVEDANAGTIGDINVPCDSSDIVLLDDTLLSDDATTGGTFSGTDLNSDGNFDPSVGPGTYEITYKVDDSADCVTPGTSNETTFKIIVGEGSDSIGTPIEPELCITEVIALAEPNAAINYFNDLVADLDPALDGDFTVQPNILAAQIISYVGNPTTPSQTFSTNYTYVSACGTVSTDISLTINNTTPADAGEIDNFSLCQNEENFDLFTKLTSDNPEGGTFSDDSGVIENGLFNISATGVYMITYAVSEDDLETCLSGSDFTEFELTVTENTIVIGEANTGIVCQADVQAIFPSVDEIRKYLISLLDPAVNKTTGTFSPNASQLAQIYQNDDDGFGDFKTKYTIVDGTCSSSVELTVTILQSLDAPSAENTQLFCSADNATVADLEVTGTNLMWFEDENLTTTADLTDSLVGGEVYYAVSISEDVNICDSAPTMVTVTIIENADAPEAEAAQNFCSDNSPTVADLVITGDNITVYEDADLSVEANSTDALVNGNYYATSFCSTEVILITVTVNDPADAPIADANQSFCLVNNNTVADLVASGENIIWYADENLTIVATATTSLENGDVYYAVATGDNTCDSPSTMVTVTMNDPDAPTLQTDGNEFCRSDNPTLQDLMNNFNGSGIQIYSSLTGGTAIASTTALQDGVEYFATATDATQGGCESSERTAIRVEVKFCGIPEGFSPNGDNINDRFEIEDIAIDFPNYTIEIYNRWGNMVFKGNASTPDWDGISNQSGTLGDGVLPVGVYFYILNYNDGATTSEQGKLYLSR